jgi:multiple sugar transport system permease protein
MTRRRTRRGRGIAIAVALIVGLAFLAPLLWVLITSLSTRGGVYRFPPAFWPAWQWSNYSAAWAAAPWVRYFANTVFICACTVALVLTTSVLAGFAFARMRFAGRNALFITVLCVMMVPQTVLIIPNYVIASRLHLLDTYWIQILPFGASVFGIFLLRQFFLSIPTEIFDAAQLDGAGPLRMAFQIAGPLARPSLILVGLNTFMGSWNAFVWPYIMTTTDSIRPIEVGLNAFYGVNGTDWTTLSAAVVFTTIPIVILFLFLQKYFVTGLYSTSGAVR